MVPIVVNPLLWYVHEQMKYVPSETLVSVLSKYYSSETIEEAKNTLFDHFSQEFRSKKLWKIAQQGPHKSENNIKDVIEVFHKMAVTEGFKQPVFVTANTDFPPLNVAKVDITALQHDIAIIKNEVFKYKEITENESIQLKELKEAVQQFIPKRDINIAKTASVTGTDVAINCQGANSIISNNKQSYSKAVTNNLQNSSQYKKSNKSSELNVDLEKNK